MQPVLDLGVLELAQVAVDLQDKPAEVVWQAVYAQVPVQLGGLDDLPDLSLQQRKLAGVQGLTLVVLVHQLLDPGDVPIAVGRGHCRDEVVDDGGVGAALGLGAFPGVVDNKGIEQGHVGQGDLRVARGGKTYAFAGQPFQGAVLPHVNHGVGFEHVPDPAVVGDVVVGRGQVRAVIHSDGVLAKPPGRLQAHEDVAQVDARDGQVAIGPIDLSRGLTPGFLHIVGSLAGKALKPPSILAGRDVAHRQL